MYDIQSKTLWLFSSLKEIMRNVVLAFYFPKLAFYGLNILFQQEGMFAFPYKFTWFSW